MKELLATLAPRPDVPARIRKLPERAAPVGETSAASPTLFSHPSTPAPAAGLTPAAAPMSAGPTPAAAPTSAGLAPAAAPASAGLTSAGARMSAGLASAAAATAGRMAMSRATAGRIEPLAPARYKLEMTIGAEQRVKLERVQALMRHRLPSGDLAAIFGEALDLLVAKLEKERLGTTTKPRRARLTKGSSRHIPRAVRRAVFERDGEQCTYRDADGHRCSARALLEIDHVKAVGHGGQSTVENLRVLCRAHNRLHAEDCFGTAHIAARIKMRQRISAAVPRQEHGPRPDSAAPRQRSSNDENDPPHQRL